MRGRWLKGKFAQKNGRPSARTCGQRHFTQNAGISRAFERRGAIDLGGGDPLWTKLGKSLFLLLIVLLLRAA